MVGTGTRYLVIWRLDSHEFRHRLNTQIYKHLLAITSVYEGIDKRILNAIQICLQALNALSTTISLVA
jgi:hypothetical protein